MVRLIGTDVIEYDGLKLTRYNGSYIDYIGEK